MALLYPVRTYFPKLFLSIPFFPSRLSEVISLVIQLVSFVRVCLPSWFPGHLVWYVCMYVCICLPALGLSCGTLGLHRVTQLFDCSTWALHLERMGLVLWHMGSHDQTRAPGIARWILNHWSNQGSPCTFQCLWTTKFTLCGVRFWRVWWTLGRRRTITAPHPVMSVRQPLTSFLKVKLFIRIMISWVLIVYFFFLTKIKHVMLKSFLQSSFWHEILCKSARAGVLVLLDWNC